MGHRSIYALLHEQPTVLFKEKQPNSVLPNRLSVSFSEVSFSYSKKAQPILDKLSLTIKANQTIGISGPSGVGKSTFVKLLMRYWDRSTAKTSRVED